MVEVIIYGKLMCPYCTLAKEFFHKHEIQYVEYLVDQNSEKLEEMLSKSNGRRTVPQIFINGKHIGGYDDLMEFSKNGRLDIALKEE